MKWGDGLFLFLIGVGVSVLWIQAGHHWAWVVGLWVICYALNWLEEIRNRGRDLLS